MRKISAVLVACATTVLLTGCGAGGLFNRVRPDEFAVQRQAPLWVPPDFALTPPQPGAPRPASRTQQQETLDAMFGGPAQRSGVERSVAARTGAPDPSIRSTVADPRTLTATKGGVTSDIIAAPAGDGREARVTGQ
ncbi:DUF3035 domain-containing protein [Novosphingobium sp. FSY-8]|uniref:DUF3035 domain-containing protein n=1 Tax=Novosphingobium ovatum TaxID=1908523 RepID=A0ABW9XEG4_9SPHN|nr:DUF3035 domain-containing protein [Novosphingobium ovatum]NBC36928.1 DUF3035 domain-containing protein [Novosphingobium ovatum]